MIQGSVTMEHWAINLKFEPVIFEDPALGVRVHRGVYEAALRLYDDFASIVKQHLASHPAATVSLSGHSLGGSLASILMLLMVYRKVLPPHRISPCYTFGAPAVFCASSSPLPPTHLTGTAASVSVGSGSSADEEEEGLDAESPFRTAASEKRSRRSRRGEGGSTYCSEGLLMRRLGIPSDLLVNVMMHKDIVPRAFVCDYTAVADLLKQWMPSFRDHTTLSSQQAHKSLYNFVGTLAVLRPDDGAHFVSGDNDHPMLPSMAGLYKLRERPKARHIADLSGSFDCLEDDSSYDDDDEGDDDGEEEEEEDPTTPLQPTALFSYSSSSSIYTSSGRTKMSAAAGSSRGGGGYDYGRYRDGSPGTRQRREASMAIAPDLRSAVQQFMNYPHPLQSLSSYGSYGPKGAISRYHNPDNYTKGLEGLAKPLTLNPKP